jgi:hypothetical protein
MRLKEGIKLDERTVVALTFASGNLFPHSVSMSPGDTLLHLMLFPQIVASLRCFVSIVLDREDLKPVTQGTGVLTLLSNVFPQPS